jgi:hypothetical protein
MTRTRVYVGPRRLLAQKEIDYGNVFVRQLARARTSGVCNLKTCNLKAIPPEVGELQQTRVMDLRDNKLDRLTDKVSLAREGERERGRAADTRDGPARQQAGPPHGQGESCTRGREGERESSRHA